MKIGVFHPALSNYGGAEFVALVVTNALARSGNEVILLVGKEIQQIQVKKMLGDEIDSSVRLIVKPTFTHPADTLHFYPTIFRSLILKSKCDVMIDTFSNAVFPWTDVCYIHFPFLNRFGYKTSFPYLKSHYGGSEIRDVLSFPYVAYSEKLQNYNDKLIIANSKFTAEAVKEFINADVKVIYPPVRSAMFSESPNSLIESPREDMVVTVSRFSRDKELEKIPYIAKLTKSDIEFVLMGLLHDHKVYESIIKSVENLGLNKKVRVMGDVPKTELESILKRAKIYLHTMIGEHFGISIVEAMARGCIPVVHDSGGMREFVPARYRYQNLEDAARKIETAMDEWTPDKAKKMIEIARQFSESNFSKKFIETFSSYIQR